MPGMLKTSSTVTMPAIRPPSCSPTTVTTVMRLLRSAWIQITCDSRSPLARAVRT